MTIRPLLAADIHVLAEALASMEPWRTLGYSAAGLAGYLAREDAALTRMVAEKGGAPSAVIAVRQPWLRGPYIEVLAVLPPAQGAGLGARLVNWAAERGGGNLWACVSAFNQPARDFYARLGFAEVAPLPGLVAEGFEEILLRRRLVPGNPPVSR